MLAFSRQQNIEPKIVDVSDEVLDLNRMLHQLIGSNIELTLDLDSELHRVRFDPGQLEQIVSNLIVNASDAMPDGGQITLTTKNTELDRDSLTGQSVGKPGSYVELSISDTGTGMTPEVQERIFEPFYTTKEKGKGTGLGLASVYGIVKRINGEVAVHSEAGVGTIFNIYSPVSDSRVSAGRGLDRKKAQD